jgi:hypothetical protein
MSTGCLVRARPLGVKPAPSPHTLGCDSVEIFTTPGVANSSTNVQPRVSATWECGCSAVCRCPRRGYNRTQTPSQAARTRFDSVPVFPIPTWTGLPRLFWWVTDDTDPTGALTEMEYPVELFTRSVIS